MRLLSNMAASRDAAGCGALASRGMLLAGTAVLESQQYGVLGNDILSVALVFCGRFYPRLLQQCSGMIVIYITRSNSRSLFSSLPYYGTTVVVPCG